MFGYFFCENRQILKTLIDPVERLHFANHPVRHAFVCRNVLADALLQLGGLRAEIFQFARHSREHLMQGDRAHAHNRPTTVSIHLRRPSGVNGLAR